jgi:hypothetical protein
VSPAPAVESLLSLSGSALLNRILEEERPAALVRRLPEGDFYWIIKRIGEEDCLPVLRFASTDQWKYLLDLEVWEKDRLDGDRLLSWLSRLGEADPVRFAAWLYGQGDVLFSLLLIGRAEVAIKDGEEAADLPAGYFTLDGRFFIRPSRGEDREAIEGLLRILARENHHAFQALLYGLTAFIPAEAEEELYRLRNGRLAEHGFLPYEEALAIYAPLDPAALRAELPPLLPGRLCRPEADALIPTAPLMHVGGAWLFAEALSKSGDPLVRDRLLLEFAGLCNQLVAAAVSAKDIDSELLSASCHRAASYLNLALDLLCGEDAEAAATLLRNNSLPALFRVGFGEALKLRWETDRWRKKSLFLQQGKTNAFWGTPWEETLEGLCFVRPLFFDGGDVQNPYRDFRNVKDLKEVTRRIAQVMALDRLLMDLSIRRGESARLPAWAETFHPLLFNRWARAILDLEMSPEPLTRKEAEQFFRLVRQNDKGPPYRMAEFKETFIHDLTKETFESEPITLAALREALSLTWEEFRREHENNPAEALERRYLRCLMIA